MAETDALTFGHPSLLLSALQTISQDSFPTNEHSSDSFVLGQLLSETNRDDSGNGRQVDALGTTQQYSNEALFVMNRLLMGDSGRIRDQDKLQTGTNDFSTSSGSSSQSTDAQLPSVPEILRPYADFSDTIPPVASGNGSAPATVEATTYDGRTVFFRRKFKRVASPVTSLLRNDTHPNVDQPFGKLLDVPIHRLLDQLSTETAIKVSLEDADLHMQVGPSNQHSNTDCSLWVDRYRPRRFTDLLGDDRVHREVMTWVKEWDFCSYGRRTPRGQKRQRDTDEENLDQWRRPKEKLLLLSGPPGMGKTTLAHVVARHAGYDVFEINASDSRSAQVIDDRIRPILEAGSAVGSKKPTLIVVDEIDGATGGTDNSSGFIQKLIQLTYDKQKKKGRKIDPKAIRPLQTRPIICICNDLYANSLTKLRAIARIVRFSRPNDVRLTRRLREICEIEGLRADSRALTTLVGVAQGDLRGCLNMLQLIKSRGGEVTEPVIRAATTGMKEAEMSQTSVLNDLFSPMARKRAKDLGISEDEEARYVGRLSWEIESSGSIDRIAQGCFEHYANLHRHDANFLRYLKANEWITSFDMMAGEMRSEREFALLQYLPYMLVAFYPLFQERGAPKVERPKVDWENYQLTKTNEEIYHSLAKCLLSAAPRRQGDYRHLANEQALRLEVAPLLNRIISPPLKPVNRQVIRPGEKSILARLVEIMIALDLRFVQEKMEDGQLTYRLDPPIDVFVTYDGKRASDIAISKYAVRHLVALEIEEKTATTQSEGTDKNKPRNKSELFKKGVSIRPDEDVVDDSRGIDGLSDSTIDSKRLRITEQEEKVAVDFFGRPITVKPASRAGNKPASKASSNLNGDNKNIYRVAYRFNEGNSAAVRKPVRVAAFL